MLRLISFPCLSTHPLPALVMPMEACRVVYAVEFQCHNIFIKDKTCEGRTPRRGGRKCWEMANCANTREMKWTKRCVPYLTSAIRYGRTSLCGHVQVKSVRIERNRCNLQVYPCRMLQESEFQRIKQVMCEDKTSGRALRT